MKRNGLLLTVGCALVLSACGGGGGGDSGGGATTGTGAAPSTPVQTSTLSSITAENSTSAAANAYAGVSSINETSSSVSDLLTGVSVTPAGPGLNVVSPMLGLVKNVFAPGKPALLAGVTMSEPCTGGGSVTLDATLRNEDKISNGDTVSLTANNCREDGYLMTGGFSLVASGVSGDPFNTYSGAVTLDTTFRDFGVTSGTDSISINGDMKIAMNVTSATRMSMNLSGKSLQAAARQGNAAQATRTMSDYSLTADENGTTMTTNSAFTVSGTSTGLSNFKYTAKNVQPFVNTGSGNPGSGSMLVTGNASSVTITALNSSSVRVDYSAKGDGVVTQTKTLSWTEFLAAY